MNKTSKSKRRIIKKSHPWKNMTHLFVTKEYESIQKYHLENKLEKHKNMLHNINKVKYVREL